MAEPYITLDGVSSITKGLRLVEAVPFIIPKRTYAREAIPGRLSGIRSATPTYSPTGWKIVLAREGADKSGTVNDLQLLTPWFLTATKLKTWHDTAKYYLGVVEGDDNFDMLSRRAAQIKIEFMCDPPCYHKVRSIQAGWEPVLTALIADQITDATETCSVMLATGGTFPSVTYAAAHPAALYIKITGTWTALTIGGASGLVLNWAAATEKTIYIDCEAQQVYYYSGGVLTSLVGYISGDFPVLTATAAIAITGTAFSIVARMLVIERG